MARGILVDSSVVIPHLRGQLDLAAKAPPTEQLFLSLIALGELYKGLAKSTQPERTRLQVEKMLLIVAVLNPDLATAGRYGEIAGALDKQGTPIPQNDIWIAATAMECDMPLATRDAHFEQVPGLQVLRW
jgi:tRNA(fMet)-specific endonuclease VapC